MARLSYAQVAHYAHVAGFGIEGAIDGKGKKLTDAQRLSELTTAVAVAFAEHRGPPDPTAVHHNTNGSIDVGVWQINSVNFAYVGTDEAHLKDPQSNAIAASSIYARAGNKFTPWTTYKALIYLAYLPGARVAAKAELGVNVGNGKGTADIPGSTSSGGLGIPNPLTPVLKIGEFLGKLGDARTWVRLVEIIFGGIFILAGLAILAKELGATDTATSLAKIVPVTKVVKGAAKVAKS